MPARQPAPTTRQSSSHPAKSTKRDGSPKARWTADQRSERGRPPRRSAGRKFEPAPRGEAPVRRERADRFERPVRAERPDRFDRPARAERTERFDRPARAERPDRFDRPERATRPRQPAAVTPVPTRTFAELGLPQGLVAELAAMGITEAFPIQAATIPDALRGRDVLGRARTGSGKTLAFALPLLVRLAGRRVTAPGAVILVPTRELAMQVADAMAPLARTLGTRTVLVAGGMAYAPQLRAFERGVDVVVATPGRLIDLLDRGAADLSRVEVVVLDEADHMADLGFTPDVRTLLDAVPGGGQRLLFSATLDGAVDALVRDYLSDPVTHEVDSERVTVETMDHHLVNVLPHHKAGVAAELAARDGRTVVFARTQLGAERTAEELRTAGIVAGALHGGLSQGVRNRVLAAFRSGQLPVLVATDVAARGIHVDDVSLVLQADPPAGAKEYLHRAGRTARAGATGVVVTLVLPHQRRTVTRLAAEAGVDARLVRAEPGDPTLAEVTGARRPSGTAVTTADYERLIAPPARPTTRRPGTRPGSRNRRPR